MEYLRGSRHARSTFPVWRHVRLRRGVATQVTASTRSHRSGRGGQVRNAGVQSTEFFLHRVN